MKKTALLAAAAFLAFSPLAVFADDPDYYTAESVTYNSYAGEGYGEWFLDADGNFLDTITLHADETADFTYQCWDVPQQTSAFSLLSFNDENDINTLAQEAAAQFGIDIGTNGSALPVDEENIYGLSRSHDWQNDTADVPFVYASYHYTNARMYSYIAKDGSGYDELVPAFSGDLEIYVQYPLDAVFTVADHQINEVQASNQYLIYHIVISVNDEYFEQNKITSVTNYSSKLLRSSLYSTYEMTAYLSDTPAFAAYDDIDDYGKPYSISTSGMTASFSASMLDESTPFYVSVEAAPFEAGSYTEGAQIEELTPSPGHRSSSAAGAIAATAAAGTALGIAGSVADNSTAVSYKKRKTKTAVKTNKLSEAVEDAHITIDNISDALVNEKGAKVSFPLSCDDLSGIRWHYISKVVVGQKIASAHCAGKNVILSFNGEPADVRETAVSVLVIGWAIGADGTLHKGFTGFEVNAAEPGLYAEYDQGELKVTWIRSGRIKGIRETSVLDSSAYTIENNVITLNENKEIFCCLPSGDLKN